MGNYSAIGILSSEVSSSVQSSHYWRPPHCHTWSTVAPSESSACAVINNVQTQIVCKNVCSGLALLLQIFPLLLVWLTVCRTIKFSKCVRVYGTRDKTSSTCRFARTNRTAHELKMFCPRLHELCFQDHKKNLLC